MSTLGFRLLLTVVGATWALVCYQPPGAIADGPYRVDINSNIPGAEKITKVIKNTFVCRKIDNSVDLTSHPFGCQAETRINVCFGSKVSLAVDRAILEALYDVKDVEIVVDVAREDEGCNHTKRIYVGACTTSGQKPLTKEKWKALLDPKLSHEAFLELIEKDDKK